MIEIGDTKVMIPRSRDGSPYDDAESRAREEQEDNERVARENQRIIETVEASIKKEAGETGNKSMEQVKEEVIDLDDNDPPSGVLEKEPPSKKIKAEFYSDNSISLPGISMGSSKGAGGPTGFEPGMFGKAGMANESSAAVDPNSSKTDGSKVSMPGWGRLNCFLQSKCNKYAFVLQKKKKKDKKKHKHKHKHKHNKDKDRERDREKDKERVGGDRDRDKGKDKKDPNIVRVIREETQETLSSADSSSRDSNPTTLDLTL